MTSTRRRSPRSLKIRVLAALAIMHMVTTFDLGEANAQAKDRTPALDAAFRVVEEAVASGDVPGAVALVAQNGKLVREQAYGLCDVERKIAFTPRTLCWIASITKPVTVAAAMKLVEEGR